MAPYQQGGQENWQDQYCALMLYFTFFLSHHNLRF